MKLASKIAASIALLGAFTVSRAESITFGVNIPPIASLLVRDGVIRGAAGLQGTIAAIDASKTNTVGGFTVVTNMPKWNLYFAFANDGNLINNAGTYLKDNTGDYLPLGVGKNNTIQSGKVWLVLPAANEISGTDGTPGATPNPYAALNTVVDATISSTQNTLTSALKHATTACNNGAADACLDNSWVFATASSTATFNIGTAIDNTNPINALAGDYTETMYVTLLTSY
jgi:hypothetical protein